MRLVGRSILIVRSLREVIFSPESCFLKIINKSGGVGKQVEQVGNQDAGVPEVAFTYSACSRNLSQTFLFYNVSVYASSRSVCQLGGPAFPEKSYFEARLK